MQNFIDILCGVGGFIVCWFTKDFLQKALTGTEGFIATMEAKIAALKAAKAPTTPPKT
jgi:hypothetical protein